jgi:hypothetical protein
MTRRRNEYIDTKGVIIKTEYNNLVARLNL